MDNQNQQEDPTKTEQAPNAPTQETGQQPNPDQVQQQQTETEAPRISNRERKRQERQENRVLTLPDLPPIDSKVAQEGDIVIAYFNPSTQVMFTLKKDEIRDTKYGHYKHNDIIGKKFGTKVSCESNFFKIDSFVTGEYMHLLRPNRVLFTENLKHRTQILYHMDIGFVISRLDIKPGDIVCESGTGSGSLSFSISKNLGSTGKLYTFEFNEQR